MLPFSFKRACLNAPISLDGLFERKMFFFMLYAHFKVSRPGFDCGEVSVKILTLKNTAPEFMSRWGYATAN